MNEALQALEIKVENGGATPQGKFFAKDWNTLVEAVKQLDLAEFDEAALNKYLKDNGYITSDDIPSTDLSDLVTLSTEQTIPGSKNFTGGIKVNGQPLIYNAELGVWELTGDLLVTGNVAWFASIKGFKPSTIMDAVQVDGETIVINELGQLKAIGGGSGGSGGGLTVSDLSNYLTTNKYTKQSDVETLISTALTPYALTAAIPTNNNQLTNGAGYITAAALNGYATEQWVGDNYLAKSGGTIRGTEEAVLKINTSYAVGVAVDFRVGDKSRAWVGYNTSDGAYLGDSDWGYTIRIGTNGKPYYRSYELIHLGNIGQQRVDYANKASQLLASDNRMMIYHNSDALYVGDNTYQTIPTHILGKEIRLRYGASAAVGMILLESGNVVIGDTSADAKLHVYGDAKVTSALTVATNVQIPVNGDRITFCSASGTYTKGILAMNTGNTYLEAPLSSDSKTASKPPIMIGWRDGTYPIYINANTNVAFGGTTADYKIHIHGVGGFKDGLWAQGIRLERTDEINSYGSMGGSGNGDLHLNSRSSGIVSIAYGGGNVSIGKVSGGASASAQLHVHGDILADSAITAAKIYAASATASSLIEIKVNGSTSVATFGYENGYGAIIQSYKGGNYFLLKDDNTAFLSCSTTINGDLLTTGAITATKIYAASSTASSLIEIKVNGSTSVATFGYENGYGAIIQSYKGGNYFLLKDDNTAFLSCSTTINGNLLVNGNVSWISQSQRSLKHITSEQGLSLAQLELIKPIKFYWKDGRDAALHVGGVADVFDEVLPEVVARNKGILCLNYVDAAFYVGASLIAPVLDHERRITEGEREREALKKENVTLKRELAIMKQMLNQLPA